ncbi:MAG: protein translocase subunit SecD [Actinomycetia bacterium]|nr:protein translocase subunit SecD [Actinomycetes bacterium]
MARSASRHGHPGRTLIVFFVVVIGLCGLMVLSKTYSPKLGLDLRGGTTITLTAANTSGQGSVDSSSLELARSIIQQRVDSLGVGESEVTTSGGNQIQVSVPNVQRDELIAMVGQTAQLEFRAVYAVQDQQGAAPEDQAQGLPSIPPPVTSRPTEPAGPLPEGEAERKALIAEQLKWTPSEADQSDFASYQCGDAFPSVRDQPLLACMRSDLAARGNAKYLLGPALLEGNLLTEAAAGVPQNQLNWVVNLSFNNLGGQLFTDATTYFSSQQQPRNQFAIVLDGKVISAPSVSQPITGGRAEISGSFNQKSATDLANVLKYGALPLAFEVSSVDNVSATLGADQLRAGLIAGLVGLALVIGYSFLYYRGLGIVVVASLTVAAAMTWVLMVLLGASMGFALSLPGIAGAIVAIGVTADSFVIYFERIRDEVRDGRSIRTAVETGWYKARRTILAADAVSMLSAVILFTLAIGAVRGFAFTLGLTTLIDVAIVFFFTKPLMSLLVRTSFFGGGRPGSGLDASHLGVASDRPLRRPVRTKEA